MVRPREEGGLYESGNQEKKDYSQKVESHTLLVLRVVQFLGKMVFIATTLTLPPLKLSPLLSPHFFCNDTPPFQTTT